MNIETKDIEVLKECKRVVEKIVASGKLPNTIEDLQELWKVWNAVYRKNDKVTGCPTCKQQKFTQLKRTYDLYDLKDRFNDKVTKKASTEKKKK